MRRPRNAATAALGVALATIVTGGIMCSGSRALADPSPGGASSASMSVNTKTKRFVHRKDYDERLDQEFLEKHMDSSGQVRPDLEQKGLEHIQTMKVAPSIGTKVSSGPSSASTSVPKK